MFSRVFITILIALTVSLSQVSHVVSLSIAKNYSESKKMIDPEYISEKLYDKISKYEKLEKGGRTCLKQAADYLLLV